MKCAAAALAAFAAARACAASSISFVLSSSAGAQWSPQTPLAWSGDFPYAADVTVRRGTPKQKIFGFGAAFTDTSAYNVQVFMNETIRAAFIESQWGASGLGFTVGRVPINSPDFSFETFNYDNVTDDFSLANFDDDLTYDSQRVIPLLRAAQAASADTIRLFGSPWSPPGWMKRNDNMINSLNPCLKNDSAAGSYRAVWAQYIVRWLRAFASKGLPMWGLTPQNEPMAAQSRFESCEWSTPDYVDWLGNFLGPAVSAAFPDLAIMGYDHNKIAAADWAAAILAPGSNSSKYCKHVAIHWYDYFNSLALDNVATIRGLLGPDAILLNTEACYLNSLDFNWTTGELYAADIIGDLNFGANGWMAWNHVLLTGTKFPYWEVRSTC